MGDQTKAQAVLITANPQRDVGYAWGGVIPKLRHYDGFGTTRFVTFNCYRDQAFLVSTEVKLLLIEEIGLARLKHLFKILAYVIMPEHVHLVLWPPDTMRLGLVIGEIKSRMARAYFATFEPDSPQPHVFWEKRCYDRNCRTVEETIEKINYCHDNPVRRKLVVEPGDYNWSSFNWYRGRRDVPLLMDDVPLF